MKATVSVYHYDLIECQPPEHGVNLFFGEDESIIVKLTVPQAREIARQILELTPDDL